MNKEILHRLKSEIASSTDETDKEILQELLDSYIASPKTFDNLTFAQFMQLKISLRQVKEGNVFSNEQVSKMARGWITKLNGQQRP